MLHRSRSFEQQVKHHMRWMVFWRVVGDCVDVVPKLSHALSSLILNLGSIFTMFSRSILYFELEQARKYRLLTSTDLALGIGEPNRYGGLRAGIADEIQSKIHEQGIESMDDDD